jgi:hypothetical protein
MACECKPGHARVAFELVSVVPGAALKLTPVPFDCDNSDRTPGTYVATTTNVFIESQNFANHYDVFLKTFDSTAKACYVAPNIVQLLIGPNVISALGGCGAPIQICTSDELTPPGPLATINYLIPFIECCPNENPTGCCANLGTVPDWFLTEAMKFGITL